jgi:signal transduction histidine kinase
MNPGIKFRLTIFIVTIGLLVWLIAWTTHASWERINESHQKLTALQQQSFNLADHLQQVILGLNNSALRYAAYRDPQDWTNFATASRDLQGWMDTQESILSTAAELPLVQQIKVTYHNYLSAAGDIHAKVYGTHQAITRVAELADFEKQSKLILDQGFQLANVHQNSLSALRDQNIKSLDVLRQTLLGALALLILAGVSLAIMIYRDLIAPLQVQLVESRHQAERQEKLASLGLLAAGVAHEIRNPLTAIKAWLFLQQKHLSPGTPEFADAQIIGGEIDRLERIVRDFLQFARPSEPQFTIVPADQPLREVLTLMELDLNKREIKITLETSAPAQIRIDPQQMKQVLINLVQNAADSIGKNGAITLRVRLDEKRLIDRPVAVVILEIQDTGKGIPPEAEKRLFDPFFTTRESGTGLGLPIAARIVEKHQGALQYRTRVDHGTTFGIILPRTT